MTVFELIKRFREIPPDLHSEPVLERFATTFDEFLKVANKPSNCSTQYDAGNQYYLKLIAPMGIYGFRLCTREDCLEQMESLIEQYHADPQAFKASLLPDGTAAREVRGPGCT